MNSILKTKLKKCYLKNNPKHPKKDGIIIKEVYPNMYQILH